MKVLLKNATIIHPSIESESKTNILVKNGKVLINPPANEKYDIVVESKKLMVSLGWVDLSCFTNDPGFEFKDTLESVSLSSQHGGFTKVCCLPNTFPIIQTKDVLSFIKSRNESLIDILPIGAVSKDLKGEYMNDLLDLMTNGAVAFSDGYNSISSSDLLVKTLEYLNLFDGILIERSNDLSLSQGGVIHEGNVSTRLGLKGIPSMAEELIVIRDIEILKRIGGRLHFSCISTSGAVNSIRSAKKSGLRITADIGSHYLALTDQSLMEFDSINKVFPPYRTSKDRKALLDGLVDGTIDAVISDHRGQDSESKNLEFDLAEPGIINLQTSFSVLNTHSEGKLTTNQIVDKICYSPRRILKLDIPEFIDGMEADLTVFDPEADWEFTLENNKSKSINSPFFNKRLKGKVLGVFNHGQYFLSK